MGNRERLFPEALAWLGSGRAELPLDAFELHADLARAWNALSSLLREHPVDEVDERRRAIGAQRFEIRGGGLQDRVERCRRMLASEGQRARRQFEQEHSERPDVRARVDCLTADR